MLAELPEPITPRACLSGGRTEVFSPYRKLSDREIRQGFRIVHIDVASSSLAYLLCNDWEACSTVCTLTCSR